MQADLVLVDIHAVRVHPEVEGLADRHLYDEGSLEAVYPYNLAEHTNSYCDNFADSHIPNVFESFLNMFHLSRILFSSKLTILRMEETPVRV